MENLKCAWCIVAVSNLHPELAASLDLFLEHPDVRDEVTRVRGTGLCLVHAIEKLGSSSVLEHLTGA